MLRSYARGVRSDCFAPHLASKKAGIPVVGVYETMPTPGYTSQSWMLAEVAALEKAVTDRMSTESLQKGH